jgi:hypothetical protein
MFRHCCPQVLPTPIFQSLVHVLLQFIILAVSEAASFYLCFFDHYLLSDNISTVSHTIYLIYVLYWLPRHLSPAMFCINDVNGFVATNKGVNQQRMIKRRGNALPRGNPIQTYIAVTPIRQHPPNSAFVDLALVYCYIFFIKCVAIDAKRSAASFKLFATSLSQFALEVVAMLTAATAARSAFVDCGDGGAFGGVDRSDGGAIDGGVSCGDGGAFDGGV